MPGTLPFCCYPLTEEATRKGFPGEVSGNLCQSPGAAFLSEGAVFPFLWLLRATSLKKPSLSHKKIPSNEKPLLSLYLSPASSTGYPC